MIKLPASWQGNTLRLRLFWQGLARRDRLALQGLAIFLAVLLLTLGGSELIQARHRLAVELPREQARYQYLLEAAAEWQRWQASESASNTAPLTANSAEVLSSLLKARNLKLDVQTTGEGRWQIQGVVRFDDFLRFLADISQQLHLRVTKLTARRGDLGLVVVDASLESLPKQP